MGFNFGSDILAFLLELPDAASFSDLHSPSSSELESCFEFFGRSVDSSRELRGLEPVGLDLDLPLDERARLPAILTGSSHPSSQTANGASCGRWASSSSRPSPDVASDPSIPLENEVMTDANGVLRRDSRGSGSSMTSSVTRHLRRKSWNCCSNSSSSSTMTLTLTLTS